MHFFGSDGERSYKEAGSFEEYKAGRLVGAWHSQKLIQKKALAISSIASIGKGELYPFRFRQSSHCTFRREKRKVKKEK